MNLIITEKAQARLRELLASISEFRPAVCVGKVKKGTTRHVDASGKTIVEPIDPGWGVGFYDISKLSPGDVLTISGFNFLIDETLNGRTLDYENGRFVVSLSR